MKDQEPKYAYFVHDNAAFRGEDDPLKGVEHVNIRGKWEPYKGDPYQPQHFGRLVPEEVAMKFS